MELKHNRVWGRHSSYADWVYAAQKDLVFACRLMYEQLKILVCSVPGCDDVNIDYLWLSIYIYIYMFFQTPPSFLSAFAENLIHILPTL